MIRVDVQYACSEDSLPTSQQISKWVNAALPVGFGDAELAVRIVDCHESASLNKRYRGLNKPTNVLSFPLNTPSNVPLKLLGDLAICAPIVASEARDQGKRRDAHWAHLVIHGVLHLLGYDHEADEDAANMEFQEIRILGSLGYKNPYPEVAIE